MKKLILILFTTVGFSQTYVKTIKLSNVLTTTAAANPSIYKQNIFELKEFKNNTAALDGGLKIGMFYSLPMKDNISLIAVVKPKEPLTANVTLQFSQTSTAAGASGKAVLTGSPNNWTITEGSA